MTSHIPFNRPFLSGSEFDRMKEAVAGLMISEGGPFTDACEELLQTITGAGAALITSSCTHALEMSALLLDLSPGDEVVMPSFTFVSAANAFALRGAQPVFADCRSDTLNVDVGSVTAAITPRTRAIVVMHYAGVACEMDEILAVAADAQVPVIEDNAHGLLGTYKTRPLGTLGAMATQSFHETKNLTCGKGGALLINDLDFFERARSIRSKGTNRAQYLEGQVDKYTWVELGSAYLPSDLLSAFLLCQLEERDRIQGLRRALWARYNHELSDWASQEQVQLPVVPDYAEQTFHMFYLLLPTASARTRFISHMRSGGAHAVFHYVPLHQSPMGQRLGADQGACPVTTDVSSRLVRLPFYTGMTGQEQSQVIQLAQEFRC